jgi:arabinoxylan arabinofuranohydrolase
MKKTIFLFFAISTLNLLAQKQILPDFQADPSAHVFGKTVWIYPSHDIAGSKGWDMVDWHAFSSTDLEHWTDHGIIFGVKDLTWASKYAWAPDCISRNGKYYFYFPADFQIGVAVSKSPAGPFKDALGKPLIARNEGGTTAMDPCIFIDDDGQAYLYYGQNDLRVVKLDKDMITKKGEITNIPVKNFHEGIWMHKRNGLYYLSYPSDKGDSIANQLEYSIGKTPYGPFEYKGIILDNRSRNVHHSIVKFKDKWYLFYHVQGPSHYERRVCLEYLEYNTDGTIKPIKMTKEGVNPVK